VIVTGFRGFRGFREFRFLGSDVMVNALRQFGRSIRVAAPQSLGVLDYSRAMRVMQHSSNVYGLNRLM